MSVDTVRDLLELLESYDPETPLRIATQPSWPLASTLAAVTLIEAPEDDEDPDFVPDRVATVWLAASDSVGYDEHPYAPRDAWNGGDL